MTITRGQQIVLNHFLSKPLKEGVPFSEAAFHGLRVELIMTIPEAQAFMDALANSIENALIDDYLRGFRTCQDQDRIRRANIGLELYD